MSWIDYCLAVLITLPILAVFVLGFFLAKNGRKAMGKPTIQPFLFYSGKFLLFGTWFLFWIITIFPEYRDIVPFMIEKNISDSQKLIAAILLIPADLILVPAFISMGLVTHISLPDDKHELRTGGIYKISRNPMYASFFFLNPATFLYLPSVLLLTIMIYGMIVHHFIILSEEKYLEKEFGGVYLNYKKQVPRYF